MPSWHWAGRPTWASRRRLTSWCGREALPFIPYGAYDATVFQHQRSAVGESGQARGLRLALCVLLRGWQHLPKSTGVCTGAGRYTSCTRTLAAVRLGR